MKKLFVSLFVAFAMFGIVGLAQAELVDRGGGLLYDTFSNLTWLQDVSWSRTSGFDDDGLMDWDTSMAWADGLEYYDSVRDTTWNDWYVPTVFDYTELCYNYGITPWAQDPFINIDWDLAWTSEEMSGTEAYAYANLAGHITFKGDELLASAVRVGNVVPIPGAVWLLGSGLIGLVGFRKRFRNA